MKYRCRGGLNQYNQSPVIDNPNVLRWLADNNCEVNQVITSKWLTNAADARTKIIPRLKSLENYGIPYWIEIETAFENTWLENVITPETQPFNDAVATVATTGRGVNWPAGTPLPSFETMFGAGITEFNTLGSLFQGYSIEGGFDNGLLWLRQRCNGANRKISSYNGGIDAWNVVTPLIPPNNDAGTRTFPSTPPYHSYSTQTSKWWYERCNELIWEVYCLKAVPYINYAIPWFTKNTPSLLQGLNTIMDWTQPSACASNACVTWWGQYMTRGDDPTYGPEISLTNRKSRCSSTFRSLDGLMNVKGAIESNIAPTQTTKQVTDEVTWFKTKCLRR